MRKEKTIVTQFDAVKESMSRLQHKRDKPWGLDGHDMGIHDLNMLVGGWIPGKLTTIAGRSGMGKTALTTQMFQAGARPLNNRRAEFLFFTWEMSPSYLVDRHICNKLDINSRVFTQGIKLFDEARMNKVKGAYKEAKNLPVQYQTMSTNIGVVKAVAYKFIEECKEKEETQGIEIQPVIIVDYVGMARFDGSGLRTYAIGEFMNECKALANNYNASVCVFAQISRDADAKDLPVKSDLSDSKDIENASDNLVLIHRPEHQGQEVILDPTTRMEVDSKNKMLLRVAKGRDFGTGDVLINSDIAKYRFWTLNTDFEFEYWHQYQEEQFWREYFNLDKLEKQLRIA